MEWRDRGLVLGARRHGETGAILETMTAEHGRHLGLVHGGRSRALRPVLQPGNSVALVWRARLDEQLGAFQVEPERVRADGILGSAGALAGIATVSAHLGLLPERDPHRALFEAAEALCEALAASAPEATALLALFELHLLGDLGFGLDLETCAATGTRDDLVYLSPRSGRAVSREAGAPYRERLLPLPPFLRGAAPPDRDGVLAALRTLGIFLESRAYGPRNLALPDARARFLAAAERTGSKTDKAEAEQAAGDSVRDGEP